MASLSTCHLGLWLGWQILLNVLYTIQYKNFYSAKILGKPNLSSIPKHTKTKETVSKVAGATNVTVDFFFHDMPGNI